MALELVIDQNLVENQNQNQIKVYKSNRLIEARYNLSLNEQKLILYASSKVDNFTGDSFTILKMPVLDFFKISGVDENSKNHSYVKSLVLGLMDKKLEVECDDGGWEIIQWVSRCRYRPRTGIIEFEFSPAMKPFLLELEQHYKGYPLNQVMQLSSKYSIRMYELLIQWEYTSHKSLTIEVEELRKKLGLVNEYERFTNFETFVVKAACDELNEKSNIYVEYEKIKKGRRIHEIKFKFIVKEDENARQFKALKELKAHGFAQHLDKIRSALSDKNLVFDDLQLDEAYMVVHNKLVDIDGISDCFLDGILSYMTYYYDYTLEKANNRSFNYYIKALREDYHNITQYLKFGQAPNKIKYNKLH